MKRLVKILIPIFIMLISAVTARAYDVVNLPDSMPMSEALGIFSQDEVVRATIYNIADGQYIELDKNDVRNFLSRAGNMTVYRTIDKTPFRGTVINLYTANGAMGYNLSSGVQIGLYGSDNYVCYKVRGDDEVALSYIDTMYKDTVESDRSNGTELFLNTSRDFLKLPDAAWAQAAAKTAASESLLPYEFTKKYGQNISRGDFCILLGNFLKVASNCASLDKFLESRGVSWEAYFSDCGGYDNSINMLCALGIVSGLGDGTFNPEGSITREQAASMLCRAAEKFMPVYVFKELSYSDRGQVSEWSQYFVRWVTEKGVMTGVTDTEFQPGGEYTVEQAIATIARLYSVVTDY